VSRRLAVTKRSLAERTDARVTGLMEPLRVVEIDALATKPFCAATRRRSATTAGALRAAPARGKSATLTRFAAAPTRREARADGLHG